MGSTCRQSLTTDVMLRTMQTSDPRPVACSPVALYRLACRYIAEERDNSCDAARDKGRCLKLAAARCIEHNCGFCKQLVQVAHTEARSGHLPLTCRARNKTLKGHSKKNYSKTYVHLFETCGCSRVSVVWFLWLLSTSQTSARVAMRTGSDWVRLWQCPRWNTPKPPPTARGPCPNAWV